MAIQATSDANVARQPGTRLTSTESRVPPPSDTDLADKAHSLNNKAKLESSVLESGQCHELSKSYRWRPSLFRVRPMVGIAAILVAIICLFVSFAILESSNGKASAAWSIAPTVYLATATAISNTALNVALAQAAPISWWYKALRRSTIQDLELQWQAGQSFPRALIQSCRQRRPINLLTIAGIFVATVVIDGPLLQRASSERLATLTESISLNISISPELPRGFSGHYRSNGNFLPSEALFSLFDSTIHYSSKTGDSSGRETPIIITSAHCSGECRATILAPGIALSGCTSKTWPITEQMLHNASSTWGPTGKTPSRPIFFSDMSLFENNSMSGSVVIPGPETALLTTGFANYEHCSGEYIETKCTVASAIVEQDVTIRGHQMSLDHSATSGRVVARANNTFHNTTLESLKGVTLMGLIMLLMPFTEANVTLYQLAQSRYPSLYMPSVNLLAMKHIKITDTREKCAVHFSDPTNAILMTMNDFMFPAGVLAGTWQNTTHLIDERLSPHQTVQALHTEKQNVFRSDLRFFAGAAVIQVFAMLLILPVFWGWWTIGVDMTLSPFHTAKMLDAPILQGINSAAGYKGITNEMGARTVKLGLVEVHKQDQIIQWEEKTVARAEVPHVSGSRIGITDPSGVAWPRKDMRFTY